MYYYSSFFCKSIFAFRSTLPSIRLDFNFIIFIRFLSYIISASVFLNSIPKNVTIVPKIESPKGVKNIEEIIKKLDYEEQIVMLDHDDLFSNIKKENEDPSNFQKYIKILIEKCRENNVSLLRTIGVVFGTEEKRTTDYVK